MTELAATNTAPHPRPPLRTSRPFWVQALGKTFIHNGARAGLAWIALLVFFAVFAPVLASSHPILMKEQGHWSSPMLRHLTPADVLLMAVFFAGVIVLPLGRFTFRRRMTIVGIVALGAIALGAVFVRPPSVVVYEKYRDAERAGKVQFVLDAPIPYSPRDRMRDKPGDEVTPPWWATSDPAARAAHHWLGTATGADMASRMIHASRTALAVGFIATGIAIVIGVVLGGLMGYFAGPIDLIGMRLVEILESIPTLFLLLMAAAFFPGNPHFFGLEVPRIYFMMVIIGLTGWSGYARFVRAEFLKLRRQDFVQAAVACGLPLRSILFRHMLPNGLTPVLVSASFGVASAILAEATLSFLGLGLVDEASWGQLLNQATSASGAFSWWIAVFPGAAIFLTVFAYTLIGESLRDAIDPHLNRAAQM